MRRISFILGIATLLLVAPARLHALPAPIVFFEQMIEDYDQVIMSILKAEDAPGVAVTIVKDNRVVYMNCYGLRHAGQPEPVNRHTVFRIASVSKGFASVLTGLFVDEKRLRWDDPIYRYIPSFMLEDSVSTRRLTIRNILSHTSGFPPYAFDILLEGGVSFDAIMEELKLLPIVCPAGECYNYQNVVYSLIGEVLEGVTGQPYQDLVMERIFKPLGMHDASMSLEALTANRNSAAPHVRTLRGWKPIRNSAAYYSALPAAGVNASISDMAQWLRALMGGMPDIVPPHVVRQTTTPVIRTRREQWRYDWNGRLWNAHYGMGWRIFNYAGTRVVFHSGGVSGFRSQIAFIPEYNVGIAVLINGQQDYKLVPAFLDMYLGLPD